MSGIGRRALRLQALYYLATGVWPLLHLRSFELVSGPKQEGWLVKTVGLLIAVIGVVLWRGSAREPSQDVRLLAAGSAASLAAIDVWYVAKGRIRVVYLLDALVEIPLVVAVLRGAERAPSGAGGGGGTGAGAASIGSAADERGVPRRRAGGC